MWCAFTLREWEMRKWAGGLDGRRWSSRDGRSGRGEMDWEVKILRVWKPRDSVLTKNWRARWRTHRRLFHQGQYSTGGQASLTQNPSPQGKASRGFIFSGEAVQPRSSRPHTPTHTYSTLCTLYLHKYPHRHALAHRNVLLFTPFWWREHKITRFRCVFYHPYRPDTDITASLHDQVDKLEKHLRYVDTLSRLLSAVVTPLFSSLPPSSAGDAD